ncbi:MAG: hypothetical protein ACRC1H_15515, partial [Caldilineaceae bacterium]
MVRLWITLSILIVTPVAAVFNLRQQARAERGVEEYAFPIIHLVVLVLAFVVGALAVEPVTVPYKGIIGFVLLVLILREAFAWIPGTPRAATVGANFFVWFLLWLTFSTTVGKAFWSWQGLIALAPLVLVAWPAWRMRARTGALWLTLVLYSAQVALALGFVLLLVVQQFAAWSICALLATVVLASADLLMGRDM